MSGILNCLEQTKTFKRCFFSSFSRKAIWEIFLSGGILLEESSWRMQMTSCRLWVFSQLRKRAFTKRSKDQKPNWPLVTVSTSLDRHWVEIFLSEGFSKLTVFKSMVPNTVFNTQSETVKVPVYEKITKNNRKIEIIADDSSVQSLVLIYQIKFSELPLTSWKCWVSIPEIPSALECRRWQGGDSSETYLNRENTQISWFMCLGVDCAHFRRLLSS